MNNRIHTKDYPGAKHVPYGYCMVVQRFETLQIIVVLSEVTGKEYTIIL
jgi:hypothetical protein